ncbi:MAG: metallopeptidase TldD-related protein [Lachnospiraceae bacterium]|nr:metallopeptidase TldD-related protein [Lachnospiraceae bacterium]
MNTEKLLEILKASEADGFEVTDTKTRGWEFYFIRHQLDQNRARQTRSLQVRVFKSFEDGKYLGSAVSEISPMATSEDAEKLIRDLVREAGVVKNPAYRLNGKSNEAARIPEPVSAEKTAGEFLASMMLVPETDTEDINSYELFVEENTRRIVNSEGVDVTEQYPSSMLEVVVNARNEDTEIELYRMYESGTCDPENLIDQLVQTMQTGKDRLRAVPTPALNQADVIFSTDAACEIFDYFLMQMNAALKYQGLSSWEIGTPITEQTNGDSITLRAVRKLPNSSQNYFTDAEGAVIHDRTLIRGGIPENFWGNRQFSEYMELRDSSIVCNYLVEGGEKTAEELRTGRYLEIVEFSDFQCNPLTGDLAGEIRLGYLHDESGITVVSGGSVSGSIRELISEMRFSKEQKQYNNALIPAVVRLNGMTVTGKAE